MAAQVEIDVVFLEERAPIAIEDSVLAGQAVAEKGMMGGTHIVHGARGLDNSSARNFFPRPIRPG